MVAGTPLTFRFTMGDRTRRGWWSRLPASAARAPTLLEIPRSKGWDVTFTATGDFTRTRTEHSDTDTTTAALSWTTPFRAVRFDGGSYNPLSESALSADACIQEGTLGDGHYTCDATPTAGMATLLTAPAPGGDDRDDPPFSGVVADMATEQCVREGYGGDYGHYRRDPPHPRPTSRG